MGTQDFCGLQAVAAALSKVGVICKSEGVLLSPEPTSGWPDPGWMLPTLAEALSAAPNCPD